jgi:hypothetical protein
VRRALATNIVVFLGYAGLSFVYFGIPLARHPGRAMLGSGQDPQIFVWSFAWWEHAIATWTNPLYSHAIYAPDGVNLAWVTSVSGLAAPFAPLTAIVGPVASYNVAALLLPALAAWTAFLLCRYLTGSVWPALLGGYLFGFSSYEIAQVLGHMHMTSIFLLPLVALVALRYLRGELTGRGLSWRLGLLLGWQLWISTEVFFTVTLALVVSLALAYLVVPEVRARVGSFVVPALGSYGLAAVVAAPLLVYVVKGFNSQSINLPQNFDTALLNFVVPTHLLAITSAHWNRISMHFPGGLGEQDGYIGIPALAIVVWFAVSRRRSPGTRFLLATFLVAVVASLGTALYVKGHPIFNLPGKWIFRLPIFDNTLPERLSVYTALAVAVIVALWVRRRSPWYALPIAALAVVAILPAAWDDNYRDMPQRLPFFTQALYKICIPRDENVAIFPYGVDGYSTLWQAESGFYFNIAEGYLIPKPPKPFIDDPLVQKLTYTYEHAGLAEILAFARRKRVARVISVTIYQHPSGAVMKRIGPTQYIGGVMIAPACGYAPLGKG